MGKGNDVREKRKEHEKGTTRRRMAMRAKFPFIASQRAPAWGCIYSRFERECAAA